MSVLLGLLPLLWDVEGWSQTAQQDRRIEEDKRDSLKPTVALPHAPPTEAARKEPPVPQPIPEVYLLNLLQKRIAFHYDAAKAMVILMGVDEEYIDLSSQAAYLRDHGFLPKRLTQTFDPMQPLRKGVAAYMVHRALGITGGLAWHLFGPTERYALKELTFRGIMAPGHANDLVSGEELIQIMDQALRAKLAQQPKPAQ